MSCCWAASEAMRPAPLLLFAEVVTGPPMSPVSRSKLAATGSTISPPASCWRARTAAQHEQAQGGRRHRQPIRRRAARGEVAGEDAALLRPTQAVRQGWGCGRQRRAVPERHSRSSAVPERHSCSSAVPERLPALAPGAHTESATSTRPGRFALVRVRAGACCLGGTRWKRGAGRGDAACDGARWLAQRRWPTRAADRPRAAPPADR